MSPEETHNALLFRCYQLLQDASEHAGVVINEDSQRYLLLTIVRYLNNEQLAMQARAFQFSDTHSKQGIQITREHGDHCLMMAGLFPDIAIQKGTRILEYIEHGKYCFEQLGLQLKDNDGKIFSHIAEHFLSLTEVLHSLRYFAGSDRLNSLTAFELWAEGGSQSAYRQLTCEHQSLPLAHAMASGSRH